MQTNNKVISDFIGKYGQSSDSSAPYNFWTAQHTIDVGVDITSSNIVNHIIVLSPTNWSDTQIRTFCEGFLPDGSTNIANVKTPTGANLLYTTSTGQVGIMVQSGSGCTINNSQG